MLTRLAVSNVILLLLIVEARTVFADSFCFRNSQRMKGGVARIMLRYTQDDFVQFALSN